MQKLRDFYRHYRPYIGTDALMYAAFAVVLGLLVALFG